MTTPLRELSGDVVDGVHLLSETSADWRDGGEEEVYDVLGRVEDRSVLSDELRGYEHTWETEYHFSSERSHIMRALDLPADATVLEVGAGCGAVTRYLGETVAAVDALEPDRVRARAAARRCADLDGVRVHFGPVEAVPAEPTYDVVVVVGVLEYVGGRDGIAERVAWLRHLAATLKPGGALVLAIENRLGVQYVTGAPEDHLARPFAGLEDYPEPGPVRTFDRATLEALFAQAGLAPRVHHVFPDYKYARIAFSDGLLDGDTAPVAWRTPSFPSGASPHFRPTLTAEEPFWRSLVRAGLGGQFANSFLVIATPDGDRAGADALWPADRLATFWGHRRRPLFAVQTEVRRTPDGVVFERARLRDDGPTAQEDTLQLRPKPRAPLVAGTPIIELLEAADADERVRLLGLWRRHVERAPASPRDIELGPQHVLLTPDGDTAAIDEEWFDDSYTLDDVLQRGVLTAAIRLAGACPPSRWPEGLTTVGDLAEQLAREADVAFDLDAALEREARMLAAVIRIAPDDDPDPVVACAQRLRRVVDRPLYLGPLGQRADVMGRAPSMAELEKRATDLHHTVDWLHAEVARRDQEIASLRAQVDAAAAPPPVSTAPPAPPQPSGGALRRLLHRG
ncbi:MAG TPA: methyltransferase domain-containing protein [Baekduia sp.]|uniref:methyltransferase domain-containing protein n=1 Tax=Baekduia sp. TaxID=2600305 RepID=UPI002D78590B|nr:methyltransferase domain-containing protein [Baekduia sp.]HET6509489.1 methyltransferase domain-containing protein [Baekduia sp.]